MNPIKYKDVPRSPIKYFGGKSVCLNGILAYIPDTTTKLCSPFLGGGAVELACNYFGIDVVAYDASEPLINFWNHIFIHGEKWGAMLEKYFFILTPELRASLYKCRGMYHDYGNYKKAFLYLLLNFHCYMGRPFGGLAISNPESSMAQISNVKNLARLNRPFPISQRGFRDSIADHPDHFLYLDPPYWELEKIYTKKLIKEKSFSHNDLYEILNARDSWILSYNDRPEIRDLYKKYRIIRIDTSNMVRRSRGNNLDILILSNDIEYLLSKNTLFPLEYPHNV